VLSHSASIDPDQLAALQAAQTHVAVTFRPLDRLIADEARAVAKTSMQNGAC
jgi:hypothetical protein